MKKVFENGEVADIIVDYDLAKVNHVEVKNATHKIVNSIITPIINTNGKVTNAIIQSIDLTAIKNSERELKKSAERFERWKSSNFIGIIHSNAQGKVIDANDAMLDMIGYSKQDLSLGKLDWSKLTPPEFLHLDQNAMTEAADKGSWTPFEKEYFHKDGRRVPILIGGSVFEETLDEYIVFIIDLSEQIKAKEALQKSEEGLKEAQRLGQIGSWELDLVTNTLEWSDEIYRMFDQEPRQFKAKYETFLENIHPDDRDSVNEAYTESVKNKTPYDIVHRLLLKNGKIKFVNERCETFYDDTGKAIRSAGTVHDITERKIYENELTKHRDNLEELVLERTTQIKEKNVDLERFYKATIDREFRIKELRTENEKLTTKIKKLENNE